MIDLQATKIVSMQGFWKRVDYATMLQVDKNSLVMTG